MILSPSSTVHSLYNDTLSGFSDCTATGTTISHFPRFLHRHIVITSLYIVTWATHIDQHTQRAYMIRAGFYTTLILYNNCIVVIHTALYDKQVYPRETCIVWSWWAPPFAFLYEYSRTLQPMKSFQYVNNSTRKVNCMRSQQVMSMNIQQMSYNTEADWIPHNFGVTNNKQV